MKIILHLLFLINCSLCLGQIRKGIYTIQREKNAFGNVSIISGSVVNFATNQPLKVAIVKIDTTLIQTDTLGRFRNEENSTLYHFINRVTMVLVNGETTSKFSYTQL